MFEKYTPLYLAVSLVFCKKIHFTTLLEEEGMDNGLGYRIAKRIAKEFFIQKVWNEIPPKTLKQIKNL